MIVLFLDISTKGIGYCFSRGELEPIDWGTLSIDKTYMDTLKAQYPDDNGKGLSIRGKFVKCSAMASTFYGDAYTKHIQDLIVVEEGIYSGNQAFEMGMIQMAILDTIVLDNLPFEFLNVATWKHHLMGHSAAKKDQINKYLRETLGIPVSPRPKDFDASDAVGMSVAGWRKRGKK